MSITVQDVRTSLLAKGYAADAAALVTQIEMVKSALRRVYTQRRWRFLQKRDSTLTLAPADNGIKSLSTLTGLTQVDAIRLSYSPTETYDLAHLPKQDLRSMDQDYSAATGTPEYWTLIDKDTVQFWPRADRAYTLTVDYLYLPPLPTADTDVLVFPDEHLDVLAWACAEEMAYRQRDWAAADRARARYDEAILAMVRDYGLTQRQTASEIGRWPGWDVLGA